MWVIRYRRKWIEPCYLRTPNGGLAYIPEQAHRYTDREAACQRATEWAQNCQLYHYGLPQPSIDVVPFSQES